MNIENLKKELGEKFTNELLSFLKDNNMLDEFISKTEEKYDLNKEEVKQEYEEIDLKENADDEYKIWDENEIVEFFQASFRESRRYDDMIRDDEMTNQDLIYNWRLFLELEYEPTTSDIDKEISVIKNFINEYEQTQINMGSMNERFVWIFFI